MQVQGSLAGDQGNFTIDAGATLELVNGDAAPVLWNPATLKLDAPAAFTGPIEDIVVGDAIDLAGITASSATYSGSTLTINETNGQQLVYNNVSGSLTGDAVTVASDTNGGTLVYWTPTPASESWNGTTADWSTPADWSDNVVPDDTLTDATLGGVGAYTVTIGQGETFTTGAVLLDDANATLTIIGALDPTMLTVDAGSLTVGGLIQGGAGTLTVSGAATFSGGTIGGAGTLTVSGAATFGGSDQAEGAGTTLLKGATTDAGEILLDGGYVLANAGTFDVTGSAVFYLGYNEYGTTVGGGTIQNNSGGTFDFQTATTVQNNSGTNAFVNAGTLEQTVTTGTTYIDVTVDNTGTVSVRTGTLELNGGGTSTAGTFTVASGATLDFGGGTFTLSGGSFGGDGAFEVSSGVTLDFVGGASTLSGGSIEGAGTLLLAGGSAAIVSGAKISVSDWSISGSGTGVTLGEALTYAKAFSEGAGATVILSGGNLTLTGSARLAGGTVNGSHSLMTKGTTTVSGVTIGGTVVWDNTKTVTQIGAVTIGDAIGDRAELDNASTGIYDIADDSGIARGSSTASSVKNAGLFEKTGGKGTSAITPRINNTGAIAVTSGTLDLEGAVTGAGTDTVLGDSTLEFGSTVSGNQTIDFAGGRSVVDLIDPHGFSGQIENFASPNAVDLSGNWVFSAFSENSGGTLGTLTLASGATHLSLNFIGDYTKGDFAITSGTTTVIAHT